MEYAATVWSPHRPTAENVNELEIVHSEEGCNIHLQPFSQQEQCK